MNKPDEVWTVCQGRNCDNRASGLWLILRWDGKDRLAKLCAECGLHDVPRGTRSVGTRQNRIWGPTFAHREPLAVRLLATYAANCSSVEVAQRTGEGAKHWVESRDAKPIDSSRGYTLSRIVDQTPFKPFVFSPINGETK